MGARALASVPSAKHHPCGETPEVQGAHIDAVDHIAVEHPEVFEISAQADVLVEEPHETATGVPAEPVVPGRDLEQDASVDLCPDVADATRHVRTHSGPMPALHWHADDEVRHEIHHGVVAEVVLRTGETWAVSELDFSTDDAGAHATSGHTNCGSSVVDAAAKLRADPWADVSVGTRLHRSPDDGRRRRGDDKFPHA